MIDQDYLSTVTLSSPISIAGLILFVLFGLSACSTATGPVVIRDSQSAPIVDGSDAEALEKTIAIAQPVVPDKQTQFIPLVEKLVKQSNGALSYQRYDKAINLAERGLRIDRKDPRFYLVLARAYRALNHKKQSVYFAKQGLRYTVKNSREQALLKRLVHD